MGRACKLAFFYGLETDPEIAAKFLSKLTLKSKHEHIPEHVPKVIPPSNCIPLKGLRMPSGACPRSRQPTGTVDMRAIEGRGPNSLYDNSSEEIRGALL